MIGTRIAAYQDTKKIYGTTFKIDTTNTGVSNNSQFQFTGVYGTYDVEYELEGGSLSGRINNLKDEDTITLPQGGIYIIRVITNVINPFTGFRFNNSGDKDKLLEINEWGTVGYNMNSAFYGCSNLTSINTTDVPIIGDNSLYKTFLDCVNLVTIIVDNWDISGVTTLFETFRNCSSLVNINVSNWNVSSVTNCYSTFRGCGNIPSFDLSGWDVSSINTMEFMFIGCSSVTTFSNISNWNTLSLNNATNMFRNCSSVTNLDLSNWTNGSTLTVRNMFIDCDSLQEINMSNFNFSNITNMGYIFYGCSSLQNIIGHESWDLSSVTDSVHSFRGCGNLLELDVSLWNTSSLTLSNHMFGGCTSLENLDVSNWSTSNLVNINSMFSSLQVFNIDISSWDTTSLVNCGSVFSGCSNIQEIDLSNWTTSNITNMSYMFNSCTSLVNIIGLDDFDFLNVTNMSYMLFGVNSNINKLSLSSWNISSVTDMELFTNRNIATTLDYTAALQYWATLPLQSGVVANFGNIQYEEEAIAAKDYIINTFGWTITDGGPIFRSDSIIITVDTTQPGVSGTNSFQFTGANGGNYLVEYDDGAGTTGRVADLNDADTIILPQSGTYSLAVKSNNADPFTGFRFDKSGDRQKLIEINDWGTVSMNSNNAFNGCINLTTIATSSPPFTSGLFQTFRECQSLVSLDLSNWDASNYTSLSNVFYNCVNLVSINFTGWDTSNIINMHNTFLGCEKLTSIQGIENWDVSNVTNFLQCFYNCESLPSLDLSNWNTESANDLRLMFRGSVNLTTIGTVSNWNTSNVSNMSGMFTYCYNLQSIDVSGWTVSNVTNMSRMFELNGVLNDIIGLENWDISNVTDMTQFLFANVSNPSSINPTTYTNALVNWSQLSLQQNVTLDMGNTQYDSSAQDEKDLMTFTYSWTITDGGSI